MLSRSEHLKWSKVRALEYVDSGDCVQALSSMTSDLGKHPETRDSVQICFLGAQHIGSVPGMRRFIEGFN